MIRLTFLLALTSILSLQSFAQHSHEHGVCGTNEIDIERTKANIAYAKSNPLQSRMTTYVPIRYNLIGEDDGTNAVSPNNVLDLMAAVNIDFAPYDIQFFLEDGDGQPWDYTYNDDIFNDHASFQPFLGNVRRNTTNAMTIFVPNTATPPGSSGLGVTLGYYAPGSGSQGRDYLVFKKSEVGSNASTASHEIGHYFSLPHTFRGWDCTSWQGTTNEFYSNPVMETTAPCSSVPVELVSRGSDGNCATAGDLFCDTNADYNLGFGWSSCTYNGGVQDRTGTDLIPDENNFMGYFLDCNPYQFSTEQVGAMTADIASTNRAFLRGSLPTNTEEITDPISNLIPVDGSTTPFGDQATLSWDAVPNAKYYFVELSDRRSMRASNLIYSNIGTSTSVVVDDLEPGSTYYYRVRAFSQSWFGEYGTVTEFTTGTASGTADQPQAVDAMLLYPNPAGVSLATTLKIVSQQGGDITLTVRDLTGRTLSTRQEQLVSGDNLLSVTDLIPTVKGSYILSANNAIGISSQKFDVL